jgi:hypothetical protein
LHQSTQILLLEKWDCALELIFAHDAVEFLSKSAPRPWIKRMLLWMICSFELTPYFLKGKSVARCSALAALMHEIDDERSLDKARATVRGRYSAELADKILAAKAGGYIETVAHEWGETEGPRQVSPGYFLYLTNIEWKRGVVNVKIEAFERVARGFFGDEEELLTSEFDDASFEITLTGLCFDIESIELLQPSLEIAPIAVGQTEMRARIGRPRLWDWDGATTHLLTIAQKPDGLPTGTGAQAQIERLISEWFIKETNDAPAESQVRQHATKIMRALKKPESL